MSERARPRASVNEADEAIITDELRRRPSRAPDYPAEARALGQLAQEMATDPGGVLERSAELVLELCRADSAGIGIVEPGGEHGLFRWHAIVGALAARTGGTVPLEDSPCGAEMERSRVLLFNEAERFFPALRTVEPRVHENMLVPWEANGTSVGTLWAIKHTPEGKFDAEDARLLRSLARFAAAAFRMTTAFRDARVGQAELERRVEERTKALHESESRATHLLAEMQHRVRNALAVIRSINRRTAATSDTVEDYAMHLEGRIDAFARAQAAVIRDPTVGIDLEMLVADGLLDFAAHEGGRVASITGPTVRLIPRAAETMALVINELATNAVKYGALATEQGRIRVEWRLETAGDEPRLVFDWTETGMSLSGEPPRRRGFGTELIERTLAYEFRAEASLAYEVGGLHCGISLPVAEVLLEGERRRS